MSEAVIFKPGFKAANYLNAAVTTAVTVNLPNPADYTDAADNGNVLHTPVQGIGLCNAARITCLTTTSLLGVAFAYNATCVAATGGFDGVVKAGDSVIFPLRQDEAPGNVAPYLSLISVTGGAVSVIVEFGFIAPK